MLDRVRAQEAFGVSRDSVGGSGGGGAWPVPPVEDVEEAVPPEGGEVVDREGLAGPRRGQGPGDGTGTSEGIGGGVGERRRKFAGKKCQKPNDEIFKKFKKP